MIKIEHIISGTEGKPITLDYRVPKKIKGPLVVYAHGFKGFKDWGGMDLVADRFCAAGMPFLKFNFSHNGTTPDHLTEFVNKEAFKENTIADELNDFFIVFKWINTTLKPELGKQLNTALIGHSKGGTEAILFAAKRKGAVDKLITWAATARADIPWHNWPTEKIFEWHKTGVATIENSRTGESMELGLKLLEDYENHKANYNVLEAAAAIEIPWLICHGAEDESVDFKNAKSLHKANKKSSLLKIESTGHTFGRKHPWKAKELPLPSQQLVDECIKFLQPST